MTSFNLFELNSEDRNSGTSHNCSIPITNGLPVLGMTKMKLIKLVFYNTLYNINTTNYKIDFNENSTNKTTTLTPGYYNANSLATHIGTAMTTTSGGFATHTWSYSATTMKFTAASTNNFSLKFSTGSNTSSSPARELGFTDSNGIDPVDTTAGTTATANNVCQLGLPRTMYVKFRSFANNQRTSSDEFFALTASIEAGNDSLVSYTAADSFDQYVPIGNTDKIHTFEIQLLSRGRRDFNLNNSDWSMLLRFE